jgi:hypothetical protein
MKILIIKDENIHLDFNYELLTEFAESNDINYLDNTGLAKNFIIENLINKKKFLDLIIIQDSSPDSEISTDFIDWLKNLSEETYFNGYFKLESIPVILYLDQPNSTFSIKFDRILNTYVSDRIFKYYVGLTITNWRQQLLSDLDELDLDLTLNYKKTNISLALKRLYRLKILTKKFLDDRKTLDFIWFGNRLNSMDISIQEFYDLLGEFDRNKSLTGEKMIHEYFKNNKPLLLGEYKYDFYYEKQFYHQNSRKYVEPDFLNIPFSYTYDHPEIFEVKLPNHRFTRLDGSDLLKTTKNYIHQVTEKYFNYFSSEENQAEIQKRITYSLNSFDYTLLIGRKSQIEESKDLLDDYNQKKIIFQLISYDDLIERFERLYERTKKYMVE